MLTHANLCDCGNENDCESSGGSPPEIANTNIIYEFIVTLFANRDEIVCVLNPKMNSGHALVSQLVRSIALSKKKYRYKPLKSLV